MTGSLHVPSRGHKDRAMPLRTIPSSPFPSPPGARRWRFRPTSQRGTGVAVLPQSVAHLALPVSPPGACRWALLADFAPYKPARLPADNPAEFSYFFDTGGRRRCYVAPERFYDGGGGGTRPLGPLLPSMVGEGRVGRGMLVWVLYVCEGARGGKGQGGRRDEIQAIIGDAYNRELGPQSAP